jgi:hypothetical protein
VADGVKPQLLDDATAQVVFSAASSPADPALPAPPITATNGSTFKSNFWTTVRSAYAPFFPPGTLKSFYPSFTLKGDLGLPVPDVEQLFLGNGKLVLRQETMPDVTTFITDPTTGVPTSFSIKPYTANKPQPFRAFETSWPMFVKFPFGYAAPDVKWFAAEGIPISPFDDFGRENPYPLMRVQAEDKTGRVLASTDAVVPVSGEANCKGCHLPAPYGNGLATRRITPTLPSQDPQFGKVIAWVSEDWSANVNIVKLHDLMHGTKLFNGYDSKSGIATTPVSCQTCHYSPALDLAQAGPQATGGLTQTTHETMSRVMHYRHGTLIVGGKKLFPTMPPPNDPRRVGGNPITAFTRSIVEATCYQCHPGKRTQCLRGTMYAVAGTICQDCHGQMPQVGDDFSRNQPGGGFIVRSDFYTNPSTPRVPWLNEPTCGSCHTGDAVSNLTGTPGTIKAADNLRLIQTYLPTDANAKPILPINLRFAEPRVAAGSAAGNPQLFRLSTDSHGGVFCEGCHGSTHAEWPVGNPAANDNVAATELQGHAGKIVECDTCHTGALGTTLAGPHGMHPVGNKGLSANWVASHSDFVDGHGTSTCASCHGTKGEGTVLAKVAVDRPNLPCSDGGGSLCAGGHITLAAGTEVSCGLCHGNPFTGGGGLAAVKP